MEMSIILAEQLAGLFLIMMIGLAINKLGWISGDQVKPLNLIAVNVATPCLLFMSYQREYSSDTMMSLLYAAGLVFLIVVIGFVVSRIVIHISRSHGDEKVEYLSMALSNCGYMGIPLARVLYGTEGVMYVSLFVSVFNMIVWTYCDIYMSEESGKVDIKSVLLSPNIIAIVLGVLCFACRIHIPDFIGEALSGVGDMTTPLAMLIAGILIADTKLRVALSKLRVYIIAGVRLILIPIITAMIVCIVPGDDTTKTILMISASCPTASVVTSLVVMHDRDSEYAAQIFGVCTLLSVLTIPIVMAGYNILASMI